MGPNLRNGVSLEMVKAFSGIALSCFPFLCEPLIISKSPEAHNKATQRIGWSRLSEKLMNFLEPLKCDENMESYPGFKYKEENGEQEQKSD